MSITRRHTGIYVVAAAALAATALSGCSSQDLVPAASAATSKASHAAPSAPGHPATMHFVATDEEGNMAIDDLGEKSSNPQAGPDIGDVLAFTQALAVDGKPAGQVHVAAVGVDHTRHLSQVNGTVTLKDGNIEVAGIVAQTPTFTLAVTGGTGSYVGAAGTMDFALDRDTQTLTLHLQH